MMQNRRSLRPIITWSGVVLLVLVVFSSASVTVDAGTVGVVKQFGRVTGRVLDPGLNWVIPFMERVTIYNTKDVVYETSPLEKQAASLADYVSFPWIPPQRMDRASISRTLFASGWSAARRRASRKS